MQFSMCEGLEVDEIREFKSSRSLNTCYTLKRVDYICTGGMSTDQPVCGPFQNTRTPQPLQIHSTRFIKKNHFF